MNVTYFKPGYHAASFEDLNPFLLDLHKQIANLTALVDQAQNLSKQPTEDGPQRERLVEMGLAQAETSVQKMLEDVYALQLMLGIDPSVD